MARTTTKIPRLLLLLLAAVASGSAHASPNPTQWPEQFHALLFANLTKGGSLLIIDLWYDWPGGRNLNLIQTQLDERPLYDVEWNNGTSYFFTRGHGGTCLSRNISVGMLPPDWLVAGSNYLGRRSRLVAGSNYLGRRSTGGFLCDVWEKAEFIWYYEDVVTKRPVRWDFYTGMSVFVMTFEVGKVLEDSEWQAPDYCFTTDAVRRVGNNGHGDDVVELENDVVRYPRHLNLLNQI